MTLPFLLISLAAATSLPPRPAPSAPAAPPAPPLVQPTRLAAPPALPAASFVPPAAVTGSLSNGLTIVLVENHEVPIVQFRIAFRGGSLVDPDGREGLAEATGAMLTRGAGSHDADAFARAQRLLGSQISAWAGPDGSGISGQTLARNLAPTLDLLAAAWRQPAFPDAEWQVLRGQMLDAVTTRRTDPNAIAAHVLDVVRWGQSYEGRVPTEASIARLSTGQMRAFAKKWFIPEQAVILVGGDTTLAEIQPLLEARFGGLKVHGRAFAPALTVRNPSGSNLTLVDKPGAAQSIIVAARVVGLPTDPSFASLNLANTVMGGMFTSRLNMNLREDKGYTYGVRSMVSWDLAGGEWGLNAPVQTDATVPALKELLAELGGPANARPISAEELEKGRGSLVNAYPLKFEQPDWLLGQHDSVWRYNLGPDWIPGYLDRIGAVTPASAQEAWVSAVGSQGLNFVIVGDAAKIRDGLRSVGLPLAERDVDGNLLPPVTPAPTK